MWKKALMWVAKALVGAGLEAVGGWIQKKAKPPEPEPAEPAK